MSGIMGIVIENELNEPGSNPKGVVYILLFLLMSFRKKDSKK